MSGWPLRRNWLVTKIKRVTIRIAEIPRRRDLEEDGISKTRGKVNTPEDEPDALREEMLRTLKN